ncbi:mitochondrial carrier domain-containing protein [Lipomyces tetrasporus]|uniref:Mitochondrial carrier domain-containing protein n=1 Tax=Lipomyces tetrasporus TaxID=54092 RepID=A0AAD7QMV0_9ASCO|nr:mitochondrial carrier domain-containing protein [Lipomyces tetrasporus]KAJ8097806.1 mitochondrial carrier domain-containing protein [Lipomyces tetrasporus]
MSLSSTTKEAAAIAPQSSTPRPVEQQSTPATLAVKDYLARPTVSSFIAGGVAGAVSRTVVSPLERMKIIMQVQGPGSVKYSGIWGTLRRMWKEEGWRGYMRGNGINCVRIVPYSAVQYSSYTIYKELIMEPGRTELDTPRRLSAGAMAGITSVIATYPLDIVRTRLSVQTASIGNLHVDRTHAPGMWSTAVVLYRTEGGIVALYRGILPTIMGVAPYVGLNFTVYESMREVVADDKGNVTASGKLFCGAVSGAVAQTLTYPFDVLRRRFQVNTMKDLGFQYSSVWDAVLSITKKEGPFGMYKGLSANLLKVVPSMASSWLSFEIIKDLLQGK